MTKREYHVLTDDPAEALDILRGVAGLQPLPSDDAGGYLKIYDYHV